MGTTTSVVDTKLYDLLGAAPDADTAALHKAYKKSCLRLHPDKGGDPEEFKAMKAAYDVLMDPEKRKVYDKYGEEVLGLVNGEGPPTVTAMMALMKHVTKRERATGAALVCTIAGIIVCPLVMVSLRWDRDNEMNWFFAFIPLWIFQVVALGILVSRAGLPEPEEDEADMDAEHRAVYEQAKRKVRNLKVFGSTLISLLILQEAVMAARLQGVLGYSYGFVLSPWMLLEIILLTRGAMTTEKDGRKCPTWGLARLTTIILCSLRAAEIFTSSWFLCLLPLLGAAAVQMIAEHQKKKKKKSRSENAENGADAENPNPEENDDEEPKLGAKGVACSLCLWLPWLCIAAGKLDGWGISAFLIFIPFFIVICAITCVGCCSFMCISPEMVEQAMKEHEQEADHAATQAGDPGGLAQSLLTGGRRPQPY